MSKWFALPAVLILFFTAPVHADWLDAVRGFGGGEIIEAPMVEHGGMIVQDHGFHGAKTYSQPEGYPFYSGCCEPRNSHYSALWSGFCAPKLRARGCNTGCSKGCDSGCGHSKGGCHRPFLHPNRCGCVAPAHKGCATGGCGSIQKGFGGWGAMQKGHAIQKGISQKGFSIGGPVQHGKHTQRSSCDTCGSKSSCGCGTRHSRLGLFDWLHRPAPCGCGTISHGKGISHGAIQSKGHVHGKGCGCGSAPVYQNHYESMPIEKGTVIEAPAPMVAPPAPVSPKPVSNKSASWSPEFTFPVKFAY